MQELTWLLYPEVAGTDREQGKAKEILHDS